MSANKITEAFTAIKNNNLAALQSLSIQANFVQNTSGYNNHEQKTLLYYACELRFAPIVKYLLSVACLNPNEGVVTSKNPTIEKESPLYKACQAGFYEIVELLVLDNRVDLHIGFSSGFSTNENYQQRSYQRTVTPLMIACQQKHNNIVQLLVLSNKLDVNRGDETIDKTESSDRYSRKTTDTKTSTSPLYYVASSNLELVKILLTSDKINFQIGYKNVATVYEPENNVNNLNSAFSNVSSPEVAKLFIEHPKFDVNSVCVESLYFEKKNRKSWTNSMTALNHTCSKANVQVTKLLLAKPNIDINRKYLWSCTEVETYCNALSDACKSGNIELIELLLDNDAEPIPTAYTEAQMRNINLSSMVVASHTRRFGMKKFAIKQCERDRIFGKLIGFRPIIAKIVPSLYEIVINNQAFIDRLTNKQLAIIQQLIDNIIYNKSIEVEDHIDYHFNTLLILVKVYGDYTDLKKQSLNYVISSIQLETVLDILEKIETYLLFIDTINVNSRNTNIYFPQLKEYCLDYIGSKVTDPNFEKYIENDTRIDKYLKTLLKRRTLKKIEFCDESPNRRPQTALSDLFNDPIGCDIELLVGDKTLKCHKTLLETKSKFFETIFSGNWETVQDHYPPETLYIVQHCYGITPTIPPTHLIPLIKKAHEHEISELITITESQLQISTGNFFELVAVMEYYRDYPIFSSLIQKLITFGAINASTLFNSKNISEFNPKFKDDIFLRIVNSRF